MLPQHEIDEAHATAVEQSDAERARVKTSGLRRECCYCRRELPGSDPNGTRTSHGFCMPPCAEMDPQWAEAVREVMAGKGEA